MHVLRGKRLRLGQLQLKSWLLHAASIARLAVSVLVSVLGGECLLPGGLHVISSRGVVMRALLLSEVEVDLGGPPGLFRVNRDSHGIVGGRAVSTRLEAGPEDSFVRHVRGALVRAECSLPVLVWMPSLHVHDIVERDINLIVRVRALRAERIPREGRVATLSRLAFLWLC